MKSLKKTLNNLLRQLGYEIVKINKSTSSIKKQPNFLLYRYQDDNGNFDYQSYINIQTEGNKRKIDQIWVSEENIFFLSEYINNHIQEPRFGICHGTRRGKEQEWFRKYLNCEVIGTEISDTASQFPNTIQWDFHETKPEWINATDFIYSNSIDHSYDPEKCLNAWISCLKTGGICILEFSFNHEPFKGDKVDPLDPFRAKLQIMPYLITTWGKGKYGVREILKAPNNEKTKFINFIVIQKF